jgi:hypothetical protein
MRFDEILKIISDSRYVDWSLVTEVPYSLAVYMPDIAISVEWGREHDPSRWTEPWSEKLPASSIDGLWVDVRYHGAVVHTDLLLAVDGHRCLLPSGTPVGEEGVGIVGAKVSQRDVDLARAIDQIAHGSSSQFDEYLRRANFTLQPE